MRRGVGIVISAVILLAAGLFWGMLLVQAESSVFSRAPLLDELYYLDRAAELTGDHADPATGPHSESRPYFMSPLYPLLVAATGAGRDVTESGVLPRGCLVGIRLLQIVCWFAVVLLLRRIAGRTYAQGLRPGAAREVLAWVPAILFAMYRPAAVFTLSVLVELPLLLLLTLSVDLITPGGYRRWRGPLLGTILGLAILLRGTALFLVPVAIGALATGPATGPATAALRRRSVIGLLVALVLVLAPAAIHNSRLAGRLAGPTMNGGLNLYIGNGPQANGLYRNPVPGDWRKDPAGTAYLSQETGEPVSVAEADLFWYDAAIESAKTNPLRFVRLYLKKIWLHFQGWEIDQLVPLAGWTGEAPLLRGLFVPWRVIVVLGLAGLGLLAAGGRAVEESSGPETGPAARLWFWVLLSLLLGQSLFFVVSRYRLMLAPVLCLLAGAGLGAGWDRPAMPTHSGRARWFIVAAGILAVVVSQPWGLGGVRELWAAQAKANQAHRWALLADVDSSIDAREAANERAEQLYLEAMTGPATQAEWWLALALVQGARGDAAGAEATLSEAADEHPGDLDVQRMLLSLLLKQGRTEDAVVRAETLLQDHPEDAETLHNYVILLARSGRMEEALQTASELIDSHPQEAQGYSDLGVLLARAGRHGEARDAFERGLAAVPGDPALEKNLEVLNRTSDR